MYKISRENLRFLAIGILVALTISVIAVFFASHYPDGLDSTALIVSGQKSLTAPATGNNINIEAPGHFSYSSPMQNYTLGTNWGPLGGIIAMVVGTILTCITGFGLVVLLRKRNAERKHQTPDQ